MQVICFESVMRIKSIGTSQLIFLIMYKLMEDGVVGVSGVNARLHVELGNIPEDVPVTNLPQNMKVPIVLVILPKKDQLVT